MRRAWILAVHDLGWIRREPQPLVTLLLTPLLLMLFTKPLYRAVLAQSGVSDATGAELAVPGMAVMFSFFMVGIVTESVFREHGWRTWERLRASPVRDGELILGKVIPGFLLVLVQLGVLFGLGFLLVGLRVRGSLLALALVLAVLAAVVVSFAMALCAVASSRRQAFAYERLVVLVWAGIGGALVPVELLAEALSWPARLTPVYWAVGGLRSVILDGGGVVDVLPQVGALALFTLVFTAVTVRSFGMESVKSHWM